MSQDLETEYYKGAAKEEVETKLKSHNLCPAVAMYGPCNVEGLEPGTVKKWCTCGLSNTQPWCDEQDGFPCICCAHKKTGFKSLKWKVPDHPQRIYSICACKHTKHPPFCDATHVNLPLLVKERQKNCKGSHNSDIKLCTGCGWVPKW